MTAAALVCLSSLLTPGYAEVTFTIDFEIFSISQVSQVVHVKLQTLRLATFDSLHEQQ